MTARVITTIQRLHRPKHMCIVVMTLAVIMSGVVIMGGAVIMLRTNRTRTPFVRYRAFSFEDMI